MVPVFPIPKPQRVAAASPAVALLESTQSSANMDSSGSGAYKALWKSGT